MRWFRFAFMMVLLALGTAPSSAQHKNFPVELQQLLQNQLALDSNPIGVNVPGFTDDIGTSFAFLDISNGVEFNYVLCYPLASSSLSGELTTGTEVVQSGEIFVYCPGTIDLNSSAQFLVFFQSVQPAITDLFAIKSETIDLQLLTEQAVTDSFAEYCFFDSEGFDCVEPACVDTLNNLGSNTQPVVCLAGCCGNGASFRLPGIQYEMNGSSTAELTFATSFDFEDPDFQQLFRHFSFSVGNADDPYAEEFFSFQQFDIPLFQPGDTNQDGNVDLLDVAGFVDCLTDGNFVFQCDINGDQVVDLLDVAPFIDLLSK